MAYLLELTQEERRCVVGVFASEADVLSVVQQFPGLHEDAGFPGSFWLEPTELPDLTEIEYNGWVFPLCRASFSTYPSHGLVYVGWNKVKIFDEAPPLAGSYAAGNLHVNGYDFGIADGVEHVRARERLFDEARAHFEPKGQAVGREALGSQDGEYATVARADSGEPGRLLFLLDPAAVQLREESENFEHFLSRYPDDLP